ncbi:MAG TPA: hypothetical protein VGM03_23385 [Phycisphaerae bacterium]
MSTARYLNGLAIIACVSILAVALARADSSAPQASDYSITPPVHREYLDDPYLPPNPQHGPAPSPLGGPPDPALTGVQVNVDADGNNIPGDAANEPSIAIDPTNPNHIVIGWRQFDDVMSNFRQAGYAYSTDAGQTWTFPGVLTPGVFRSDPVLDVNAEGIFYYCTVRMAGLALACDIFKSTDGGVSWLGPTFAYGGDKPWMAIDRTPGIGHGNIYCSWNGGPNAFSRSTNGGVSFTLYAQQPTYIGTLTVGPDGTVYGARTGGFAGSSVRRSVNAQDGTATPTFVSATVSLGGAFYGPFNNSPNPDGVPGQMWVQTDHSSGPTHGNVYALGSVGLPGPDPLDVKFSRSTDGGSTWSAPVRVNDDPFTSNAWQWFGTMSVAPNGRIDVIWNDTRNHPSIYLSQVRYSYSTNGGLSWTLSTALTPTWDSSVGWPNQNKIGDYYHMLSDNDGASLAYAATFNGEQDIYFRRILPDCNSNGVADMQDIAAGTSIDVNANGLPDECEADCNQNGLPDSFEIANGSAADVDTDGVPDECEAALIAADPPLDNPYLPGQQPFRDVLHTGTTFSITRGIGAAGTPPSGAVTYNPIVVTFSQVPSAAPTPADIFVWCSFTSNSATCPTISSVLALGNNAYQITLNHSIPPGGCTTLLFTADPYGHRLRYEYLPGDVDMNGVSNTADLLALVQALSDGSANVPENLARYNVNRSQELGGNPVNTQDLLRLVQLLNGINTNQVWNGISLVPCP